MRDTLLVLSLLFLTTFAAPAQTIVAVYYTGNAGSLQKAVTVRAGGRKLATLVPNEVLIDTIASNERKLVFERTGFRGIEGSCPLPNTTYYFHVEVKLGGERWTVTQKNASTALQSVVNAVRSYRNDLDAAVTVEQNQQPTRSQTHTSGSGFSFSGKLPEGQKKIAAAVIADSSLRNMARPFQVRFEAAMLDAGHSLVEREDLAVIVNEQKFSLSGLTKGTISLGELEDVDYLLLVKFDQISNDLYSVQASVVDVRSGVVGGTWFGSGTLNELLQFGI